MRFITKAAEPRSLIQWKLDNAQSPQNLFYGAGGFPADAVREVLLHEQFHLCAYTMRRLQTALECKSHGSDTRHACHIEHVLPQARKVAGEDIDYQKQRGVWQAKVKNLMRISVCLRTVSQLPRPRSPMQTA
ncbi:MAG: hypothetical protein K9K38_03575 [Rhodoferax sp.]|nr:hypothetical protein [Rhodoferax sp.]MCF8208474.1 hypothetical protein [Rhodoferax sp.]